MFNWLKSLFGFDTPDTPVIAQEPEPKVEQAKPVAKPKKQAEKPAAKKTATKKSTKKETVDLDSMNKTQLLAEAKKRGVKANASLKKDEILERIKSA
jgi:hypothetical protein